MKQMTESEFNALSDEELETMDMSQIEVIPDGAPEEDSSTGSNEEANDNAEDDQDDANDDDQSDDASEEEDDDSSDDADDDASGDDDGDKGELTDDKGSKDGDDDDQKDEKDDNDEADDTPEGEAAQHKAFFDALMKPFKANGIDILRSTIDTQVSPALVLAVITVESAGRADAVSGAGAQGLMQLMPATAARMGVDETDPHQICATYQGVCYESCCHRFSGVQL